MDVSRYQLSSLTTTLFQGLFQIAICCKLINYLLTLVDVSHVRRDITIWRHSEWACSVIVYLSVGHFHWFFEALLMQIEVSACHIKFTKVGLVNENTRNDKMKQLRLFLQRRRNLFIFFAKADTNSHELTETTTTRDIDARDVIADANPNNHSSSNTEVHIAPDPKKTDNQSEHVDIDLNAGSGSVCSPSSPNLSSDPGFWSELSPSDIDY